MILGIGVDAVEVERFVNWSNFKHKTLLKVFTDNEIQYCLSVKNLSAQRFAARFAAKEAAYKATSSLHSMNFIKFCKIGEIVSHFSGKPSFKFSDERINFQIELSLSHTKSTAIAFVIVHAVS